VAATPSKRELMELNKPLGLVQLAPPMGAMSSPRYLAHEELLHGNFYAPFPQNLKPTVHSLVLMASTLPVRQWAHGSPFNLPFSYCPLAYANTTMGFIFSGQPWWWPATLPTALAGSSLFFPKPGS